MNGKLATSERGSQTGTARSLGIAWGSIALWAVLSGLGILAGVLVGAWVIGLGGTEALLAGLFLTAGAVAGSPILARGIVARRRDLRSARVTRGDVAAGIRGSTRRSVGDGSTRRSVGDGEGRAGTRTGQ